MPHSPQGDSRAQPSAPGMEHVGSKAGTATVLAGQGKPADVGSNTDVAQERSSHWCQDLLIALPPGTAFSHNSEITLAVRKGPFLPFILWQFLSQGQSLAQWRDLVFRKGSCAVPSFPAGLLSRLKRKLTWPSSPGKLVNSADSLPPPTHPSPPLWTPVSFIKSSLRKARCTGYLVSSLPENSQKHICIFLSNMFIIIFLLPYSKQGCVSQWKGISFAIRNLDYEYFATP